MALSLGAAILGAAVVGGGAALVAGKAQADAAGDAASLQAQQFQQTRTDLAPWRNVGKVALTELADLYGLPVEGRIDDAPGGTPATPDRFEPISGPRRGGFGPRDIRGRRPGGVAGALQRLIPGTPGTPAGEQPTREERQKAASDRFFTSPSYGFRLEEGISALDKSAAARGKLNSGAQGRALQRYGQGLAASEFGDYANRLASLAGVGKSATTTTAQAGAASAATQGQFIQNKGTARASGYAGVANAVSGGVENLLYRDVLKGGGLNGLYPPESHPRGY